MLTNRAIVASGLRRLGAGVREPLHHASTAALPLAGFTGSVSLLVRRYQGRRGMTPAAALSNSRRALAVQWEQ